MKRHPAGWTLLELLLSTTAATLILVLIAESLATTQTAWLTTRRAAGYAATADDALAVISHVLSTATVQPRASFDANTTVLTTDSDLHFVCGPTSELMPHASQLISDAIFFQRVNAAGVLEGCGFYVAYTNDREHLPTIIEPSAARKRFRLMMYHQPSEALPLFAPSPTTSVPWIASVTERSKLYDWFITPIIRQPASQGQTSIVADNVIAMCIQPVGEAMRCYDTRRHQWEGDTPASVASRHRMPKAIEITLLVTDEASWSKLSPATAETNAARLMQVARDYNATAAAPQATLSALGKALDANGLGSRIYTMVFSF